MADFKQLGTALKVGLTRKLEIPGVVIVNSQTINEGYGSITETAGDETGGTENVVMANHLIDISIAGHLAEGATPPKNGDTVTIPGYAIGWIDGVSLAETKDGTPLAFSCTAHGRKRTGV